MPAIHAARSIGKERKKTAQGVWREEKEVNVRFSFLVSFVHPCIHPDSFPLLLSRLDFFDPSSRLPFADHALQTPRHQNAIVPAPCPHLTAAIVQSSRPPSCDALLYVAKIVPCVPICRRNRVARPVSSPRSYRPHLHCNHVCMLCFNAHALVLSYCTCLRPDLPYRPSSNTPPSFLHCALKLPSHAHRRGTTNPRSRTGRHELFRLARLLSCRCPY